MVLVSIYSEKKEVVRSPNIGGERSLYFQGRHDNAT